MRRHWSAVRFVPFLARAGISAAGARTVLATVGCRTAAPSLATFRPLPPGRSLRLPVRSRLGAGAPARRGGVAAAGAARIARPGAAATLAHHAQTFAVYEEEGRKSKHRRCIESGVEGFGCAPDFTLAARFAGHYAAGWFFFFWEDKRTARKLIGTLGRGACVDRWSALCLHVLAIV